MKRKTCPECGRKCYSRKDGSTGCQACGFGIKPRPTHEKTLRCPFCNRVIAYVTIDGGGRCSKCGRINPDELNKQKESWTLHVPVYMSNETPKIVKENLDYEQKLKPMYQEPPL